jgi:hypothetical protein
MIVNKKNNLFLIISSLIFSGLYVSFDFHMISNGYKNFFGDELYLYLPQLMHMHESIREGVLFSGDFLTNNHATEFVFRPNLPGFNLIYIFSALIPIDSLKGLSIVYISIYAIYTMLSMYFSQLLMSRFFSFNKLYALFFAVIFTFSSQAIIAKSFPPFFFVHMSVPLLFYTVLKLRYMSVPQSILYSPVFIFVYLQGYITLSVFAVVLSILLYFIYYYYIKINFEKHTSIKALILDNKGLLTSIGIASLVVFPYYLGILLFNKETNAHTITTLQMVVDYDTFHLRFYDLLSFLSYGIITASKIETYSLYIGMLPVFLILTYFVYPYKILGKYKRSFFAFFMIYLFTLFISFGEYSSLADIFYFYAPGLNKMHMYARYMLVSHVFLSVAISIALLYFIRNKDKYRKQSVRLVFMLSLTFVVINSHNFLSTTSFFEDINLDLLNLELILFVIFLLASLRFEKVQVIWVAIFIIFLNNLTYKNFSIRNNKPSSSIIFNDNETDRLINFLKSNSNSRIIKYAEFSGAIDPYIPRNYPWYVEKRIKLSNYMGYEPHLSRYRGYIESFASYGAVDFNYLFDTGSEFIISNDDQIKHYEEELGETLDLSRTFTLADGWKFYKLNYKNIFSAGAYTIKFESNICSPIALKVDEISLKTSVDKQCKHSGEFIMQSSTKNFNLIFNSTEGVETELKNLNFYFNNKRLVSQKVLFKENIEKEKSSSDGRGRNITFKKDGAIEVYRQNIGDGIISSDYASDMIIRHFESDYQNKMTYDIEVLKKTSIDFLFYNSKNLTMSAVNKDNGERVDSDSGEIVLSPGKYTLKIAYTSFIFTIFLTFLATYIMLLFVLGYKKYKNKI